MITVVVRASHEKLKTEKIIEIYHFNKDIQHFEFYFSSPTKRIAQTDPCTTAKENKKLETR